MYVSRGLKRWSACAAAFSSKEVKPNGGEAKNWQGRAGWAVLMSVHILQILPGTSWMDRRVTRVSIRKLISLDSINIYIFWLETRAEREEIAIDIFPFLKREPLDTEKHLEKYARVFKGESKECITLAWGYHGLPLWISVEFSPLYERTPPAEAATSAERQKRGKQAGNFGIISSTEPPNKSLW